ncbi:MAG: bifunctional methylenetetrahydrofolate dehydrogenase/methenyltetrahydrofolate cyclohydrolase FolD [Clostridiales bacterium]|nr:bifunctional methylenetetrahydrofolate dehydrogenase/methenyltetrahydrofolate cyclohydrolase FolD [Clostridiales bacterium]
MPAQIIDGRALSKKIRQRITEESSVLKEKGIIPGLAVILIGDDPASHTYVNNKKKACEECGFYSEIYKLPESTPEADVLELIEVLKSRKEINGILVQSPFPKHISEKKILLAIPPEKDVDAFHPQNVGAIVAGDFDFVPCTPAGVMEMLNEYNIEVSGKHAVVIGRSNIVGKPMSILLLHKHATVTICHSRTKYLADITRQADILVAAVGRLGFVTADMVKPGAVVIDVGMNRKEDGKLAGDVDFNGVSEIAAYITPVPGGVGLMTVAMLLQNTLRAACIQNNIVL